MMIKRVRLGHFGNMNEKELKLTDGLNVILGPNEAGKTTVYNAIQHVLFTPSELTSSKFNTILKKYLPLGGGDTLNVEIDLQHDNRQYILKKTWGVKNSADLTLPDGSLIKDDITISETLEPLLGAKEGIYRSVLMTYQTGLVHTLEELKTKYIETVHTLGDLLRRSFLETDGVSVDHFKDNLQQLYDEYGSHWDFKQNKPEKAKRYKKKVGLILKTFYSKEDVESALNKALAYEEELDKINQEITSCSGELIQIDKYIEENKKIVEAARKRQGIEKDILIAEKDITLLKEINKRWPVLESKITETDTSLGALEKRLNSLEKEKNEAETQEKNKQLLEKYDRVKKKKDKMTKEEEELSGLKKLTREDLDSIQNALFELNILEKELASAKLSLTITAKKDLTLSIQKDTEPVIEQKMKKDKSIKVDAGARIKMDHPELTMEIQSGEGTIDDIMKGLNNAKKKVDDLYVKYDIDSYDKALDINKIYEHKLKEVEASKKSLSDELGEESFDKLKSKVETLEPEKKIAPLADIITELVNVQNSIENLEKERAEAKQVIEKFVADYHSHDKLLEHLSETIKKKSTLSDELKILPTLPAGVEDSETFINQYEDMKKRKEQLNRKERDMLLERANLEREAPELSSEEYQKQLTDTKEAFENVLQKGMSIKKIIDLSDRIIQNFDSSTYRGIEEKLENYITIITDAKYEKISMDESLPEGFVREDGKTLPYELLSTGTRDVLALALRLSMAEYFLGNKSGFLLMDDPLVNLDPNRQQKTADVIRKFCEHYQLLLFSCHPRHAELLGGNVIEL